MEICGFGARKSGLALVKFDFEADFGHVYRGSKVSDRRMTDQRLGRGPWVNLTTPFEKEA